MKRTLLLIFLFHLCTRLIFVLSVGFYNNYSFQSDSSYLLTFGNQAAKGNFNFDADRFIVSPLFPTLIGGFKVVFGNHWDTILVIFQLVISALSGVYIYKIAALLFKNNKTALLASFIFGVFPLTLYFTHTFSQECLFQSLLIFSFYHLLKSLNTPLIRHVIYSAVLFSLAYLTKSHILIFSIFIPLIYLHHFGFSRKTFLHSILFAGIAVVFSLPFGIYNYKIHNMYVISSSGAGMLFYMGNTEAGYKIIVDVPAKNSPEYIKIRNINGTAGYFNGSQAHYDSILSLPQKEKQPILIREGLHWIKNNPAKFVELKLYDAFFFLIPGPSWRHYNFLPWFFSFLVSLPVYVFAYMAILSQLKNNFKISTPMLYLFLTMLIFSTVFYVQNRFRTITIEPFYVVYCAFTLMQVIEKWPPASKVFTAIHLFFHRERNYN